MKHHLTAAAIAASIAGGSFYFAPTKTVQLTHEISASKHAWPDLTDAEKHAFAELARAIAPAALKFDIVCNDAGCSDLAADLDDAFEDAGRESSIDKAIGPLGYGIGIQASEFDRPAAEQLANALGHASGGRLQASIVAGTPAPGFVTILIGKKPR